MFIVLFILREKGIMLTQSATMKTRKTLILIFSLLLTILTTAQNQGQNQNTVFVGVVAAYDLDSGQSLTYKITSGNPDNFFTIDPSNGTLTVRHTVYESFDDQRTWKLTVSVTDNDKNQPLSSRATITVIIYKDASSKSFRTVMKTL
jgi:hypothetical protein